MFSPGIWGSVKTWLALRPQVHAGADPGEPDPVMALIDSHLELWRKAIEIEFGLHQSAAPRFTRQLMPRSPNCSKRRRQPYPERGRLLSTSSRGMGATFPKTAESTSRRFYTH